MNWTTARVRQTFLDFFEKKQHKIVSSAPMVLKNDPTLMFTNAGMNQFKDVFLGNEKPVHSRVTDTQKCLRVSGKHNDLEEVGVDTYHHTMFEMLGNWSFGDFFKEEAIAWAWELLTEVYNLDKDRLYVSVFAGDKDDNLKLDSEAEAAWSKWVDKDRILSFGKTENFWEMGDVGPCGPSSEIHMDLRTEAEREMVDGSSLVNKDHPQVIEIWNLVFIEFSRGQNGALTALPAKHVDTGMGLERITRALQGQNSNYDIDVFIELIKDLQKVSGKSYTKSESKADVAFRVAADHVRAIAFAIADGQLPSNNGAGYVIRRILRRAVRYGYSYLGIDTPFLFQLLPTLVRQFGSVFEGIEEQETFIAKVIQEEEASFLKTLEKGLRRIQQAFEEGDGKELSGELAFELYDTYGFPYDLTRLICEEQGVRTSESDFEKALDKQKERSRAAGKLETGDWTVLSDERSGDMFQAYDTHEMDTKLLRYREVLVGKKKRGQIVLQQTPFYPQGGGQVGDTGKLVFANGIELDVVNTLKENDLILHIVESIPNDLVSEVTAQVNSQRQLMAARNHSATHLLHHALRKVLGEHVTQKGSLVHTDYLRFDFSHFEKVTDAQLEQIQREVMQVIRSGLELHEYRDIPIEEAKSKGAMSLFGEKYGDAVRVIQFGDSKELCGGIHVSSTKDIGNFAIISESSVAAGVRRVEAWTHSAADNYYLDKKKTLDEVSGLLSQSNDVVQGLEKVLKENSELKKQAEAFGDLQRAQEKERWKAAIESTKDYKKLIIRTELSPKDVKSLLFQLKQEYSDLVAVVGTADGNKPNLSVLVSDELIKSHDLNAVTIVKALAKEIRGGGGGQPFFASAGGSDVKGLDRALALSTEVIN